MGTQSPQELTPESTGVGISSPCHGSSSVTALGCLTCRPDSEVREQFTVWLKKAVFFLCSCLNLTLIPSSLCSLVLSLKT